MVVLMLECGTESLGLPRGLGTTPGTEGNQRTYDAASVASSSETVL
jgi:hypothetical protein